MLQHDPAIADMQRPGIPVRGGGPVGPGRVRSGITDPRNHAMPRPSTLVLRSARASDLVAIKAITNASANRRAFGFVMRPVLEAAIAERRARRARARNHLVVATQDAVVIGFMRLYHRLDGATTLHEIGVRPEAQGQGVGTALLEHAIGAARARGQSRIGLATPEDIPANAWYRRAGFQRVGDKAGRKRRLALYELALAKP